MPLINPHDDGHFDLSDHDSFMHGMPHRTFARMRRDEPVAWCDYAGGLGFWSITRHSDILALNRDFRRLSSAQGIRIEDQSREEYLARRTFQETDPPEHSKVRASLAKAFAKATIAEFNEQIVALVDEILDSALAQKEFDAVASIARQLPMRMLGRILGVDDADLPWLVEKGDELIANADPEVTPNVIDQADTDAYRMMPFRSAAGAALYDYASELIERQRRDGNTRSVLHLILQPDKDGHVIPDHEFRNFFCLLVAAGNDTTRYTIAAGLQALCENPTLFAQLKDEDDALWPTAADEFIRWASPTFHFRRTATADFEWHDKTIREGDKVLLWFASGNRDDEAFEAPFTMDLKRSPNRHVAFGQGGPHVCLGMWLARLEVEALFRGLARRVDVLEQAGDVAFLRSNFVGGIKQLPVRMTAR